MVNAELSSLKETLLQVQQVTDAILVENRDLRERVEEVLAELVRERQRTAAFRPTLRSMANSMERL